MANKQLKLPQFSGGLNRYLLPQKIGDSELQDCLNVLPEKETIRSRFGTEIIGSTFVLGKILSTFEYNNDIFIHSVDSSNTYGNIYAYKISDNTYHLLAQFTASENIGTFFIFNSKLFFKNKYCYYSIEWNSSTSEYVTVNIYENSKIPVILNRISSDINGISTSVQYEYLNSLTNKYKARYDIERNTPAEGENYVDIVLALVYDYKKYESESGFNPKDYITVRIMNLATGEYATLSDTKYTVSTIYKYDSLTKTYKYLTLVTISDTNGSIVNGYDKIEIEAYTQIDLYEEDKNKNTLITDCDLAMVFNNSIVFASSFTTKNTGYIMFSEPLQENFFPQNDEFNRTIGSAKSTIRGFSGIDSNMLVFTSREIYIVSAELNTNYTTYYKISLLNNEVGLSNMYSIQRYNNNTFFIYNKQLYMTIKTNTTGKDSVAKIDLKIKNFILSKLTDNFEPKSYIIDGKYYLVLNEIGDILVMLLDKLAYIYNENLYYMYKNVIFWPINIPNVNTLLYKEGTIYIGLTTSSSLIRSNYSKNVDYSNDKFDFYYTTKAFDFSQANYSKFIESINIALPSEIVIRDDFEISYINEKSNISEAFDVVLNPDILNYEQLLTVKSHVRNIKYFAIKFKNIIVDECYINYNLQKLISR